MSDPFSSSTSKQYHKPNISNHLLELQREIKEEEEEIFALINNRSNLYSSFDDDTDDLEDHKSGLSNATTITITNTSFQPYDVANDSKDNIDLGYNLNYFQEDEDQGLGRESELANDENISSINGSYLNGSIGTCSDNINNNTINSHNRYREDQGYVSCNRIAGQQQNLQGQSEQKRDEEEQAQQDQQQEQYVDLKHVAEDQHLIDEQLHQEEEALLQQQHSDEYQRDLRRLTSNLPKPCVFFLEGNCRRSDCKYSHDLSSITCKYWIEGFCFKGDSCPFLHSFNRKGQISSLLDDDIAAAKEKLNPTFAIESESDFPSLPLDAPNVTLSATPNTESDSDNLTKAIENHILSSNPAVVFKTTKKKRKKG